MQIARDYQAFKAWYHDLLNGAQTCAPYFLRLSKQAQTLAEDSAMAEWKASR